MTDTRSYLINFLATIRGDKAVQKGLQKIQTSAKRTGVSYKELNSANLRVGQGMDRVAKVMSHTVGQALNKQGQQLKKHAYVWQDVNGKMLKTTFTSRKIGNTWTRMNSTIKVTPAHLTKAGSAIGRFVKLALRSAIIIPIWFAMRRIFMGIIRTIGDMIKSWAELDDAMARVKTVVSASSKSIKADMASIRRVILNTAVDTRVSIKELSEAFYFLRTASLTTEEAMGAFRPTISAMVGTMNNAKDTARAMAGMYNTMGKYLGDNLSVHEKFKKIADVLTYTYATQDVQLDELTAGYMKLAPYLSGLDDSFEGIIATLGFLNTRLLRSGRTGRLVGRSILQLTKNADKLAETFGITFDPDKPINFLNTVRQIRDGMEKTGKITAKQGEILREVFATRGAVPVRLLIEHFKELVEAIENTITKSKDFGERMREIRENTIPAQMARMKNIINIIGIEFLTTATNAGSFVDSLKIMNTWLKKGIEKAKTFGAFLAWIGEIAKRQGRIFEVYAEGRKKLGAGFLGAMPGADFALWVKSIAQVKGELAGAGKGFTPQAKFFEDWYEKVERVTKKERELAKEGDKLIKRAGEGKKQKGKELKTWDKLTQEIKQQSALMKILGVHELDIARYKLETLENTEAMVTEEKRAEEILKTRLALKQAELSYQRELINNYAKAEISMAKAIGASELQILQIQKQQLAVDRAQIGETQYLLNLDKLRVKEAIVLQNQKQKELQTATNLWLQYDKADKFEKGKIRRVAELTQMKTGEVVKRFKDNMYDRNLIMKYWNSFSEEAKKALAQTGMKDVRFPGWEKGKELEDQRAKIKDLFKPELAITFWTTWISEAKKATAIFREEWKKANQEVIPQETKYETVRKGGVEYRLPITPETGRFEPPRGKEKPTAKVDIGEINISIEKLRDEAEVEEDLLEKVKIKIKENPEWQKVIAYVAGNTSQ